MGILDGKKRSEKELYEEAARLDIQQEVTNKEAEIAQREAVVKQLRREYGPDWKKTLGVDKLTDLATLRAFLTSAKQSMKTAGSPVGNAGLSPLPPASMRKIGSDSSGSWGTGMRRRTPSVLPGRNRIGGDSHMDEETF